MRVGERPGAERDHASQARGARAVLGLVDEGRCALEQRQRIGGATGVPGGVRGSDETTPASTRLGRQLGRARQGRLGGGVTRALARTRGDLVEVAGELLVGLDCGRRRVPHAAVGVCRGQGGCQRKVRAPTLRERGAALHRRAHERVGEDDAHRLEPDEPGELGGLEVVACVHHAAGTGEQREIGRGLERREQQERTRALRQAQDAIDEDGLGTVRRAAADPAAGPCREHGGVERGCELGQGQRVAAGCRHEVGCDGRRWRCLAPVLDQFERRALVEARELEPRHARRRERAHVVVARAEDERDALAREPASHEQERVLRGSVEPLRVVDDREQRLALGRVREQVQHGCGDEESIRHRRGVDEAEREGECLPPRWHQRIESPSSGPSS